MLPNSSSYDLLLAQQNLQQDQLMKSLTERNNQLSAQMMQMLAPRNQAAPVQQPQAVSQVISERPQFSQQPPSASQPQRVSQPSGGFNFQSYSDTIGKRESNNNYQAVNTIGFVGKYQMGAAALEDVGLVKPGTAKKGNKALRDPSNWTVPGGLDTFLSKPELQEEVFGMYTRQNESRLRKAGLITDTTSPDEAAGHLATAHLKGVGGAIRLARGEDNSDAYGTSASSYFALGRNSQRSRQA